MGGKSWRTGKRTVRAVIFFGHRTHIWDKKRQKKLGVTPHFSRSKILNNHQLGMNNPSIIYLTYLLIHPHPTNLQNKSTSSTCYCTHLLHPPPSANIRGKVQHP